MPDTYESYGASLSTPIIAGFAITPGSPLPNTTRQIRITGVGGTMNVTWESGLTSVEPVLAGETLDWRLASVESATATGIRGYY